MADTIQYLNLNSGGRFSGEPANDYGKVIFFLLLNTGFASPTFTRQLIRTSRDLKDRHPDPPELKVTGDLSTLLKGVVAFL